LEPHRQSHSVSAADLTDIRDTAGDAGDGDGEVAPAAQGDAPRGHGHRRDNARATRACIARAKLESRLRFEFNDARLLARALTHKSRSAQHNERLEHLGDAVLGFVITDALYARFPAATEGELTRMRAKLVGREELAARARALELRLCLKFGDSVAGNIARNEGGDPGDAILANGFEAVVGAVYVDRDLAAAKRVILEQLAEPLARISPAAPKDAKTRLQEYLQKRGRPLPEYSVVDCAGKSHAPVFTVACHACGLDAPVTAIGDSRRAAEQRAADAALQALAGDA